MVTPRQSQHFGHAQRNLGVVPVRRLAAAQYQVEIAYLLDRFRQNIGSRIGVQVPDRLILHQHELVLRPWTGVSHNVHREVVADRDDSDIGLDAVPETQRCFHRVLVEAVDYGGYPWGGDYSLGLWVDSKCPKPGFGVHDLLYADDYVQWH